MRSYFEEIVAALSRKPRLTEVGTRCPYNATLSAKIGTRFAGRGGRSAGITRLLNGVCAYVCQDGPWFALLLHSDL
jgi:hypothetical protein